jgi:glycosyltransferase involved in cell wall biosynthesis
VVVTSQVGVFEVADNVTVKSCEWIKGRPIVNILKFLLKIIPELNRNVVIFSHMTDVQASIVAPIAKMLGIKHILWYAHTTYSVFLRWSNYWVDLILTSTPGSCPVKNSKVVAVGQAIDPNIFDFQKREAKALRSGVHIGRFDPSKHIEVIIEEADKIRKSNYEILVTQIGGPSSNLFKPYKDKVEAAVEKSGQSNWFLSKQSVSRSLLPRVLHDYDFFIHAYDGSLDKTLIEATMCGLPVLTTNKEYLKEFGTWTGEISSSLANQYLYLAKMDETELQRELFRRREICVKFHSISHWESEVSGHLIGH